MKKVRWWFLLLLLLGLGVLVWRWQWQVPVSVSLVAVERGLVEATVANTRAGTIKACRRARMSPSLGGQISELPVAEGQLVQKGQVLLSLWNKDLQAELALTRSSLLAAEDQGKAVCLQAEVSQRSADRQAALRKAGHVSGEQLDQALTESRVRSAECAAAQANVAVAQARVNVASAQLERTVLSAPFDGVIANIEGEINEYVTPSPPGIQTLPVIDLIAPGCFLVSVPVDEVDAPRVQPGLPARMTLDAWRGRVFAGVVLRVGAYVIDLEKQARTVEVELTFTDAADFADLLVGYSADVDIITERREDVLRIPAEALADGLSVLVLEGDTLRRRVIEKGLENWTFVEVLSGLQPGERVVTSLGLEGVEEGARATPSVTHD